MMVGAAVTGCIGSIAAGPLLDKVDNWIIGMIGYMAMGISFVVIPWTRHPATLTLPFLMKGFGFGVCDTCK